MPFSSRNNHIQNNSTNNNTNANSANERQRRGSLFSFMIQKTRNIHQRLCFQNRWRKRGVKFDPKFQFIIGQLIIKDIVQTSGMMYPESSSAMSRSSNTKTCSKKKKTNNTQKSSKTNTGNKSSTNQDNNNQVLPPPSSPTSVLDSKSLIEYFLHTSPEANEALSLSTPPYSQRCLDCTENCPICWDTYKIGEKVCWSKNVECSHAFHFDCMVTWLVDNDHCPLCRSPYLTTECSVKKKQSNNATRNNNHHQTRGTNGTNRSTTVVRMTTNANVNNRNTRIIRTTRNTRNRNTRSRS